ncbi:MAG: hypothetical protein U0P45_04040 [Acidimicrobiales bacterium]
MRTVLPLDPPPPQPGWTDLIPLTGKLGISVACPTCAAFWDEREFGFGRRDRVLDLTCDNGHEHRFPLDEVQWAKLEVQVAPWLAGKVVVLRGGLRVDLPGGEPGSTIRHGDDVYVMDGELDDAYVYRHVPRS